MFQHLQTPEAINLLSAELSFHDYAHDP